MPRRGSRVRISFRALEKADFSLRSVFCCEGNSWLVEKAAREEPMPYAAGWWDAARAEPMPYTAGWGKKRQEQSLCPTLLVVEKAARAEPSPYAAGWWENVARAEPMPYAAGWWGKCGKSRALALRR